MCWVFGLGAVTQYVGAATNFFVGIGGLFTAVREQFVRRS